MKRSGFIRAAVALLLMLALTVGICSCGGGGGGEQPQKLNTTITITNSPVGGEASTSVTTLYYDENDLMRMGVTESGDGRKAYEHSVYDAEGRKIYIGSESTYGVYAETFMEYDGEGRIISMRSVAVTGGRIASDSTATIEYTDEHGSFIQTVQTASGTVTMTQKVDAYGNPTEQTSGGSTVYYENTYTDGRVTAIKKTANGKVSSVKHEYDEDGNLTRTVARNPSGIIIQTVEYTYSEEPLRFDAATYGFDGLNKEMDAEGMSSEIYDAAKIASFKTRFDKMGLEEDFLRVRHYRTSSKFAIVIEFERLTDAAIFYHNVSTSGDKDGAYDAKMNGNSVVYGHWK